jgi:hypothetical protein
MRVEMLRNSAKCACSVGAPDDITVLSIHRCPLCLAAADLFDIVSQLREDLGRCSRISIAEGSELASKIHDAVAKAEGKQP